MNKNDAIRVIVESAESYQDNLENKNVMFVFDDGQDVRAIEASFEQRNYLHLTGVRLVGQEINTASDFYLKCLQSRLKDSDFEFTPFTRMKLEVLPQLMSIHKTARMIGSYNFTKSMLETDVLAGNVVACMGFVRDDYYYIPNTVLKEDIRDFVERPAMRIVSTFCKSVNESQYTEWCYIAKGIDKKEIVFPSEILNKIDRNNLQISFIQNPRQQQEPIMP